PEAFEVAAPIVNDGTQIGAITLSISLAGVNRQMEEARSAVIVMSLALFAIGVAASFAVSTLITRPLQRIADTAEEVRQGRLLTRAAVRTRDEVGELATTFNMMLDSIVSTRHELESVNQQLEIKVEQHRHEAEERRQLAHKMTRLVESTSDGIIATDATGVCVLANEAAKRLLGDDCAEIIGGKLQDLLHLPNGEEAILNEVMSAKILSARPATLARSDGTPLAVELSSAPIVDGSSRLGFVLSFRDVSERETLRKGLEDSKRINSLGQLAATVAHEINNVLMSIQPFAEIILSDAHGHPRLVKSSESILQSVRRGKRVTSEVLQYTRPHQPKLLPLDAVPWLHDFASVLRTSVGAAAEIHLDLDEGPLMIDADREQLEQVFTNLVVNARDAMPDGGTILVRCRDDEEARVHFEVIDSGCGISPETLKRIFEPFFSTKGVRGTGLGLAIAQQMISAHRGELRVESTVGVGTTFHIVLPRIETADQPVGDEAEAWLDQPLARHRIVLVEDDALVANGIESILESAGASVEVIGVGAGVIPAIRRMRPSGVVLDIELPDIDGVTVYRELDRQFPGLPVIFSTGHGDESQLREYLARPHVRFLQKPYDAATLIAQLLETSELVPAN
ncbi:MAG TPA: ATP-binding protein, partial [Thermoanaerobaculia bacterium]